MKKTHIIALVLLSVSFAVIIGMVGDYSSYVSFEAASENPEKEYHVAGTFVKDKDLVYNPEINPNIFSFYMLDRDGNERKVISNSDIPQDFELSEEIVVIGNMKEDVFYAKQLLTKCPSKYNSEEIAIKSR